MNSETTINREMQEQLAKASAELCAVTVFEGRDLADSPGGHDEIWMDLRAREFGLTPTLAHILTARTPTARTALESAANG